VGGSSSPTATSRPFVGATGASSTSPVLSSVPVAASSVVMSKVFVAGAACEKWVAGAVLG